MSIQNDTNVEQKLRNREFAVKVVEQLFKQFINIVNSHNGSHFTLKIKNITFPSGNKALKVEQKTVRIEFRYFVDLTRKSAYEPDSNLLFEFDASGDSENNDLTSEGINSRIEKWIDSLSK